MIKLSIPLALAVALAAASARADTPPPPRPPDEPSRLVDIEVKDQDKASAASTHFTIAVAPNGTASTLMSGVGDTLYNIKVRHDVPSGPSSYSVELERRVVRKATPMPPELQVFAVRTLAPEKREVVGAVERQDGSHTENALTLH
jgi:hypothetical protein